MVLVAFRRRAAALLPVVLLVIGTVVVPAATAGAAELHSVDNANPSGPGSLPQAVADAIASPAEDVIVFAPATDGVTLPAIDINNSGQGLIVIRGNGSGVTLIGKEINVNSGFADNETNVEIVGVSVPEITVNSGFGSVTRATFTNIFVFGPGDIEVNSGFDGSVTEATFSSVVFEDGGEFGFNSGGEGGSTTTALIENSTIKENADNGLDIDGDGTSVTVVRSTLVNNEGGAFIFGGELQMENSTITTSQSPGVRQFGGAVTLRNVTISGNELGGIVGPVSVGRSASEVPGEGTVTMGNSIVAANGEGASCASVLLVSSGGNLSDDVSCGLSGPRDKESVDPLLGPLAENGGPTLTFLPADDSPAIDAAVAEECPDVDQRGFARHVAVPVDGGEATTCDSGSVEVGADVPVSTTTTTDGEPPLVPTGGDCDQVPEACAEAAAGELPRTGSGAGPLLVLGGTLVAGGVAMAGSARRRRRPGV